MIQTYSISEGRKVLGDLVGRVKYLKQPIGLGHRNKVEVLLVPYEFAAHKLDITQINHDSPSFSFLNEEPELYQTTDLIENYR